MPLEMQQQSDGSLEVRPVGTLVKADYPRFTAEFDRQRREHGKLRVLTDLTRFRGWDAGGFWEEIKFDVMHIASMERLAILSDEPWQRLLSLAAKAFLPAKTRFFHLAETAEARRWVAEP